MLRVIRELRPTWVLGENVPGIVNLALDTVLSDLEEEGYAVQCFRIPACGVDAPHKRERIAIVAYSIDRGSSLRRNGELQDASEDGGEGINNRARETAALSGERRQDESGTTGMADGLRAGVHETDTDAYSNGLQGRMLDEVLDTASTHTHTRARLRRSAEKLPGSHSAWDNWPDEPGVDRVVDRLPNRMDRIKCLGNAVVPQQFYPFFAAMAAVECGETELA